MMFKTKLFTVLMAIALFGVWVATVAASTNSEPFESENYSIYGGTKDGTFSLTYVGRGCPATSDPDDYRFRVNVNRSYPGNDWKMYSSNSRYQHTPTGRVIFGFQLNTPNAYVCIGYKEFSPLFNPFSYWNINDVQQNVYTWRR